MGVRVVSGLVATLCTGHALAGAVVVPNEFFSGTRARAADVNANFEALADAINDNDRRLSALEAGPSGVTPTPLNVVQQDAEIDDVLMLNGENVTITGFDFIGLDDDAAYTAEIPSGPLIVLSVVTRVDARVVRCRTCNP